MTFNFTFNDPYPKAPNQDYDKNRPPPKPPPKTCEEWLNSSSVAGHLVTMDGTLFLPSKEDKGIVQWPNHAQNLDILVPTSLRPGDQQKPIIAKRHDNPGDAILGTLDEIKEDLKNHAPWDSGYLESINQRLQQLELNFDISADPFISSSRKASKESAVGGGLMNITDKTFLTELGDELLSLRNLKAGSTGKLSKTDRDSSDSAELNSFSVLQDSSLISVPLPRKLETVAILNIVSKAANIPQYLMKPWKKIFFCKASTSMLQNTFWWIWMDYFKPDEYTQSLLFNHISEDFVSILTEMDDKYKDEIFMHYPVYLTQALYSAFCHAFPKSNTEINTPDFLEYISNTISEWILGVKSQPGQWKSWPRYFLNPLFYSLESGEVTEQKKQSFTEKDVMRLSEQVAKSLTGTCAPDSEQIKVRTAIVALLGSSSRRRPGIRLRSNSAGTSRENPHPLAEKFSLSNVHMGPGPVFECVRFSIYGRSPLLQHYLHHHNFTKMKKPRGPAMSRTQIKEILPVGISYRQVVKGHENKTQKMYRDYESKIAQSDQEIVLARGKHLTKIRRLEKKNKHILQRRHEVAMIAGKLVASKKEDQQHYLTNRPNSN